MTNDPTPSNPETGVSANPDTAPAIAAPPASDTDIVMKRYDSEQARWRGAQAASLKVTKPLLFAALTAAGITQVTVEFEGSGDSGQIEIVWAVNKDNARMELPAVMITHPTVFMVPVYEPCEANASGQRYVGNTVQAGEKTQSVTDLIETIFWDFIGARHGGWENDDGGYGTCIFDVGENTIRLEMHQRYTETNYFEHEI